MNHSISHYFNKYCIQFRKCTLNLGVASSLFLLVSLLGGCASTKPQGTPLPEVDILQLQEESSQSLRIGKETRQDLDGIQVKILDLDQRLASIEQQLEQLSLSTMDEIQGQIAVLREEVRILDDDMRIYHGGKSDRNTLKMSNTFTPNPIPQKTRISFEEKEAVQYKRASDAFNQQKYQDAILHFSNLLKKYPNGVYSDKAAFWMGESHFFKHNYAKAILAYRRVLREKHSTKRDDAQYRIGLCYLRVGEKARAVDAFQKLLLLHADSEYVARAKKQLQRL